MYDYFYGAEADQFSFYRIPKVLFTEERFKSISAEAKVLYGLLLDRMSLSARNGWLDDEGRVYIIFSAVVSRPLISACRGHYDIHGLCQSESCKAPV